MEMDKLPGELWKEYYITLAELTRNRSHLRHECEKIANMELKNQTVELYAVCFRSATSRCGTREVKHIVHIMFEFI